MHDCIESHISMTRNNNMHFYHVIHWKSISTSISDSDQSFAKLVTNMLFSRVNTYKKFNKPSFTLLIPHKSLSFANNYRIIYVKETV